MSDIIMRDGFEKRLTLAILTQIMPQAYQSNLKRMVGPLNAATGMYAIRQTVERMAAFLATVAVETGEFKWLAEIWGPTEQQKRYDPPGKLADMLGNIYRGDGHKFKGRGLIMITGRSNYTWVSQTLGLNCVEEPSLLEAPFWAAVSSGLWWGRHKCNMAADTGGIESVTRIVNGGLTHIDRRRAYYNRAIEVLS